MESSARSRDESFGSVFAAFAANTAIAIAKGTAAALTGSPALFAETLHTIADAGNEVLLFIAIRRSRRPPDASHPFGYGPERYYWALLAAIGMFVVGGAVSIWDGVRALLHPPELEAFWAGVAVLVIALSSTARAGPSPAPVAPAGGAPSGVGPRAPARVPGPDRGDRLPRGLDRRDRRGARADRPRPAPGHRLGHP